MEETKEPPSSVGGEIEKELHYEDQKSLPIDFEKDEETSHDNEKGSLETIGYHSETYSTMEPHIMIMKLLRLKWNETYKFSKPQK